MATVLVVDDEPIVRDVVVRYLEREGYATLEAGDGNDARRLVEREAPDLVVLDVMLPGADGLELCRWIRSRSELPVIMLTARGEEADRIVGLELGADDYVTKPFSPRELAARVRTVLRRSRAGSLSTERLSFGDVDLDAHTREVRKGGAEVRLTAKEFDLLWFLASHPRRVFGRDQLMSRVWGYEAALDTGTVTVHVRRLREKIEDDPSEPRHLQTVWGVGYRRGSVMPLAAMIGTAATVAVLTLAVGLLAVVLLRLLPSLRLQLAGLAALSVCLPLLAVLLSGWVAFHMGDDVKILAVSAASATVAVVAGLVLARSIVRSVERVRDASARLAGGRPHACARPSPGPRRSPTSPRRSTRWRRASSSSSTRAASSSRGRATISGPRSRTCRRCSRRSRTASSRAEATLPVLREQVAVLSTLVDDLFELARIDAGA